MDSRMGRSKEKVRDDHIKQLSIQSPYRDLFPKYMCKEKIHVWGCIVNCFM